MQTLNYDYSEQEFEYQYTVIYEYLTAGKEQTKQHCSVLLNGLPGSGKSHYYSENPKYDNSIVIDTDTFRRFHPRIDDIKRLDAENYAERTQAFASRITEKLLQELSSHKFNLIVEGTLRTSEVPEKTCNLLKSKEYQVDLVVVACDARTAWNSTMTRAQEMLANHEKPRLVPIDKFDYNTNHIVENLQRLIDLDIFDDIQIVNRDGKILNNGKTTPVEALAEEINVTAWNKEKSELEYDYLQFKAKILQQEIEAHEKH